MFEKLAAARGAQTLSRARASPSKLFRSGTVVERLCSTVVEHTSSTVVERLCGTVVE